MHGVTKIVWFLLITNLVTLVLLGYVLYHFRVPQKAFQRIVVEQRIPLITPKYEINRSYSSMRELQASYARSMTDTLVVGDSLVSEASWQELLASPHVAGRGIAGDTTAGVLNRIEDYLGTNTRRLILWVGTNDVAQIVDKVETVRNIELVLMRIERENIRVAIIECLPVAAWIENAEARNRQIFEINSAIAKLSARYKATIIKVSDSLSNEIGNLRPEMTRDGIHLNSAGYAVVSDRTLPFIDEQR